MYIITYEKWWKLFLTIRYYDLKLFRIYFVEFESKESSFYFIKMG